MLYNQKKNKQKLVSIYFDNKIISDHTFHTKSLDYIINYYALDYRNDSYESSTTNIANQSDLYKNYKKLYERYYGQRYHSSYPEKYNQQRKKYYDIMRSNLAPIIAKNIKNISTDGFILLTQPSEYNTYITFTDDSTMTYTFNDIELKYISQYCNLHFSCAGYKSNKCINDKEYTRIDDISKHACDNITEHADDACDDISEYAYDDISEYAHDDIEYERKDYISEPKRKSLCIIL